MNAKIENLVFRNEHIVAQLVENMKSALIAPIINSVVMAFIIRDFVDQTILSFWVLTNICMAIARYVWIKRYKKLSSQDKQLMWQWHIKWIVVMVLFAGIAFGWGTVLFWNDLSTEFKAVFFFVCGGMVSGSVAVYSIHMGTFFAYTIPVFLLINIQMFNDLRTDIFFPMITMGALYYLIMGISAVKIRRYLHSNIDMRLKNEKLVADLSDEKKQITLLNKQMTDVLDHISEGCFTIDIDGRVNAGYSAATNKIFQINDATGLDITELLQKQEMAQEIHNWLELIKLRYGILRPAKLLELAPVQEFSIYKNGQRTYIRLFYKIISDQGQQPEKIMITAVDITDQIMLSEVVKKQNEEQKAKLSLMVSLLDIPDYFAQDFFLEGHALFLEIKSWVQAGAPFLKILHSDESSIILGKIHSLKGDSGSFSFRKLTLILHEMETQIEKIANKDVQWSDEIATNLLKLCDNALFELAEMKSMHTMLQKKSHVAQLLVDKKKLQGLMHEASMLKEHYRASVELDLFFTKIAQVTWPSLEFLFDRHKKMVEELAKRWSMQVELFVEPKEASVSQEIFRKLDSIFVLLFRNAMVHAFSKLKDKEPQVTYAIKVEFAREASEVVFLVRDNGHGIDPEELGRIAVQKKIVSQDTWNDLSHHQRLQLIFAQGFTTQPSVNLNAGRGYGLSVVKKKVEELGGSVEVNSVLGMGSCFCLKIPIAEQGC
jgi:signal transduction histidine kinase